MTNFIHIPSHSDCGNKPVISEQELQLDNSEKNSEKNTLGSEKSSEKTIGAYGMVRESNKSILDAIRQNANISAAEIAMSLGISSRTVEKRIRFMRENGIIRRVGPDKGGFWEVISD